MKKLILVIALILSNSVNAFEVPKELVDAVITVRTTDGKEYKFSSNKWKVVPRVDAPTFHILPITDESHEVIKRMHERLVELSGNQAKKNRVRVLGGVGPGGLNTRVNGSTATVENGQQAVGGVGYERSLNNRLSVGGEALSNGTYLLDLGVDF